MKLKPAGIIAVLLIIAVLAYFALKPRMSDTSGTAQVETTSQAPSTVPDTQTDAGRAETSPATNNSTESARTFNYTPEKPQNGTLRGVVEVGATGFNSFVINMDAQKRWEIVSKDFGESLAYEGLATTDDIRAGLKKYLSSMFDKGVSSRNMHFVISSGAQKEPKTITIGNELKKMGYVVNNVTAEQEAKFGFSATVPPAFADNSFLVDIGSGNTKISWQEGNGLKSLELPGAKYFEHGTSDADVFEQVKKAASAIPSDKRNVGFILGGVPFTLAKQHRNRRRKIYRTESTCFL